MTVPVANWLKSTIASRRFAGQISTSCFTWAFGSRPPSLAITVQFVARVPVSVTCCPLTILPNSHWPCLPGNAIGVPLRSESRYWRGGGGPGEGKGEFRRRTGGGGGGEAVWGEG